MNMKDFFLGLLLGILIGMSAAFGVYKTSCQPCQCCPCSYTVKVPC